MLCAARREGEGRERLGGAADREQLERVCLADHGFRVSQNVHKGVLEAVQAVSSEFSASREM